MPRPISLDFWCTSGASVLPGTKLPGAPLRLMVVDPRGPLGGRGAIQGAGAHGKLVLRWKSGFLDEWEKPGK